ncbi:hypothetical protein, partial [Fulvimarina sp. MAC3]|uniref:hypothetical protein n=1 Tax=Fulvimarina sp. MAC3 TaxID=3148887 RepID=UPI0031FDC31D
AARSANTKIKKSSSSQQTNKSPGHKPGLLRVSKPQKEVAGSRRRGRRPRARQSLNGANHMSGKVSLSLWSLLPLDLERHLRDIGATTL